MSTKDVLGARVFKYGVWPQGFSDSVAVANLPVWPGGVGDCIVIDRTFPVTLLGACAGKPIQSVINVPVTRERFGPTDTIRRAFWDDEVDLSVFEIERKP